MSLLPHSGRIAFLLPDKRGFLGHDVAAHSGRIAAVAERREGDYNAPSQSPFLSRIQTRLCFHTCNLRGGRLLSFL